MRLPQKLRRLADGWRGEGLAVGLVPTMGALHEGHLSLVRAARRECQRVVVSIFVNPLQFGPGEDYRSYPRRPREDLKVLAREGVDAVYQPAVRAVYPKGFATAVTVSAAASESWEGAYRPGHFQGVATVVAKLFAATGPSRAYFGEKDAQQAALVSRLAQDLDLGVEVAVCPTVRDPDGLALSSRNAYLSETGRRAALCLCRALRAASAAFSGGETSASLLEGVAAALVGDEPGAQLDYAAVVDPVSLERRERADAGSRLLLAARVEGVRLIDNCLLGGPPPPSGEGRG